MKNMFGRTLILAVALVVAAGSLLAGPSHVAYANEGKTLRYVMAYPPITLDPPNIEDSGSSHIAIHVTEPLVMIGADNRLRPHLATDWYANEDATVWTVHLREGVQFTDGTPFNADAVKYTFDRAVDPDKPTKQRSRLRAIDEVRIVDDYTVQFVMHEPYVELPFLLRDTTLLIVSPTAAERLGDDFARQAVGTGPYIVESFTSNQGAVLRRNPNYWQSMGNVERLEVSRVSEYSTRRFMLQRGEAHLIQDVLPEDIQSLSNVPGVEVVQRSSNRQFMISMNTYVEPFNDKRVRQAINYAVDVEAIAEFLFLNTAIVNDSPVPPSAEGYTPVGLYPYDPEKARQLLAEAGYPNGFEANLWGPTPGRLLMGSETVEQVQSDLAKVGIRTTISEADGAANIRRINLPPEEAAKEGKHLMYLGGPASRGIQAFFRDFFITESWAPESSNRGYYSNPRVDALVAEAGRTGDDDRRQEIYTELQEIIADDAPWLFLFTISLLWGHSDDLEGLEFLPNDLVLLTKASFR